MTPAFDPNALVQQYRPLYQLHSEEMWYPCHPEDQLRCANLLSVADGSVVIPALGEADGSPADQFLCTPLGLQQLAARGVNLDAATVAALQWAAMDSPHYAFYTPSGQFVIQRADAGFLPPYGWIDSVNFQPQNGTWFHRGAPNNPQFWLGGDAAGYAANVLDPPPGVARGAWQEPVTAAWVQQHTVAGVAYVDVIYTVFLAWNGSISLIAGQGEHPNDVETIGVRLAASDLTTPVRYFFQQHGGFSWYDPAHVETSGSRLVVYLARESHECYPHPGRYPRLFGIADDVCDAGLLWDAPVQYVNRPQGVDAFGIDTDALRCTLSSGDPNDVVLVPLDDPGPLWQYVRFLFLALRPPAVPLTDDTFTHQPFPLSTLKWWPGEGPAGSTPPLSTKAAEASAPGVPVSFFNAAAPFLGVDPMPSCNGARTLSGDRTAGYVAAEGNFAAVVPGSNDTIPGSAIGGSTAALAPNAPFVNWRGAIGAYLLGSINTNVPAWLQLLPDPLTMANITVGGVTIEQLSITGLRQLIVAPVTATAPTTVSLHAAGSQLDIAATISFANAQQNVSLTATLSSLTLDAVATLITPVAIPAASSAQWYVPYVGPAPYSYATEPFSTTSQISSATIAPLAVNYTTLTVDTGNAVLNGILDALLVTMKDKITDFASTALASQVNTLVTSIYDGTTRF